MNNDISEKLNAVLADPEKLSQVMSIVNSFRGENKEASKEANDTEAFSHGGDPPPPAVPDKGLQPSFHELKEDKRICLLLALKPYLTDERASKVDKIIRIMQLGEVAGQFKNFL